MKKLVPIIFLLILLLFSCKKESKETINLFDELNDKMPWEDYTQFAKYTDYLTVPDFLTEQQADLYKKAAILHYIFKSDPLELENIPLPGGIEYRNYANFEELVLSVFTRELFEELNKEKKFVKQDDNLYISGNTEIVQMSLAYAPWHKPDKIELISKSETEIKFNVTGYYFEELPDNSVGAKSSRTPPNNEISGEITSLTIEIILTRTETGWRFSQFATAGNPYVFDS